MLDAVLRFNHVTALTFSCSSCVKYQERKIGLLLVDVCENVLWVRGISKVAGLNPMGTQSDRRC